MNLADAVASSGPREPVPHAKGFTPIRARFIYAPHYPLPGLKECAEANLAAARLTNRGVRLVGAALNTSGFNPAERAAVLAEAEGELGVPAVDPMVTGVARIVDGLE